MIEVAVEKRAKQQWLPPLIRDISGQLMPKGKAW
jgi:hypothetical protein